MTSKKKILLIGGSGVLGKYFAKKLSEKNEVHVADIFLNNKKDMSKVRIWGYRNVWYRFDAAEADIMFPVSLNSMAVLRNTFLNCYLS